MLLTPYTRRARITATSATEVNFASTSLTYRPIKLATPSGRIASITVLPTAVTISGAAGTYYVFAALAAPTGTAWGGALGYLDRIQSALPWNRGDWSTALKLLLSDDGSLAYSANNSAVTLVTSATEAPSTTHRLLLGSVVWSGTAITSLASFEDETNVSFTAIHGQVRLALVGANMVLQQYNGSSLVINGTSRVVDAAGAGPMTAVGLTPGTFYYFYASWTGSVVALEVSTTGTTVGSDGVVVKSGDATRTFVGTHLCVTGPAWSTTLVVRSHFNDPSPTVLIRAVGNPLVPAINTSTTETTLLPEALKILASTITLGKTLRVSAKLDYLNSTGSSRALTLRLKIGGVTIATIGGSAGFDSNATQYGLWPMIEVTTLAASVLAAAGTMDTMGNPAPGNQGVSGANYTASGSIVNDAHTFHNAAAVDWTINNAIDFTAQHDNSSAQQSVRILSILVEIL